MSQDTFARSVAMSSLDNTGALDIRLTNLEDAVKANLKRVIVPALPTEGISTSTIYMVPKSLTETNQGYDEFMYIENQWEKIGDTKVDLTPYRTAANQDIIDATKQDTISDLANIRTGAALGATALQEHQSLAAYRTSSAQDVIDNTKQDVLTAGNNITISNNVISASGGVDYLTVVNGKLCIKYEEA